MRADTSGGKKPKPTAQSAIGEVKQSDSVWRTLNYLKIFLDLLLVCTKLCIKLNINPIIFILK